MDNGADTTGVTVLDIGKINLINSMGGDDAVIASARVSNGVEYKDSSKGKEKDDKLINYLLKHRHGTPFEHTSFTFYVKAPLFVVREWQRHRMGSFNEISGRYVEFEPEFYTPNAFRAPGSNSKQGSVFPDMEEEALRRWNYDATELVLSSTFNSYRHYRALLDIGIAKEMARIVLPLNLYSQFYWTVNARSLMNFLSLRNADNAQWEIRQYAQALEKFFEKRMPLTYNAFVANERVAP